MKKENAEDALKEVETMAAFNHQNILRMIGIGKNEGKRTFFKVNSVEIFL